MRSRAACLGFIPYSSANNIIFRYLYVKIPLEMRLRRTVLARLAPLLGVSALMAIIAAGPEPTKQPGLQSKAQHPLVRLIHSVFQLVSPAADSSSARSSGQRPSPRAFLSTSALAYTPLGHS